MNTLVENLTGMNTLTDRVIATDLLFAAKSGIKTYAVAVTETATPEAKQTLTKQLNESIVFHEKMTQYMMSKGWYHPYNVGEQLKLDMNNAQTAMNLVQ
jgi:similar to spore coat protein